MLICSDEGTNLKTAAVHKLGLHTHKLYIMICIFPNGIINLAE